jgi:hypothetical protein
LLDVADLDPLDIAPARRLGAVDRPLRCDGCGSSRCWGVSSPLCSRTRPATSRSPRA